MFLEVAYYDEVTWQRSKPELVIKAELNRFAEMCVCAGMSRKEVELDESAQKVKTKWVRAIKGFDEQPAVQCQVRAHQHRVRRAQRGSLQVSRSGARLRREVG